MILRYVFKYVFVYLYIYTSHNYICIYIFVYIYMRLALMRLTNQVDVNVQHRTLESLICFIRENKDDIAMVWMAPPCGTASRARERPLKHLERQGLSVPKPRSKDQPDQLDGLSGLDKIKTKTANILYDSIRCIAETCVALNIFFVIENPGNSHFWTTTPVLRLQESFTGHFVSFHNCCHGRDRDKLTSLLVNFDWLDNLEATCNGQHAHKPWKPTTQGKQLRFPTSEEASYPHVLCSRIISKIASVVSDMGATITETLEEQLQDSQDSAADRLVLSALPSAK